MTDSLLDRVITALRAMEWLVENDASPGGLHLAPSDGDAPWPVVARVGPDNQRIVLYSLWPEDVPEDRREAVTTLITDLNFGDEVGAFELDRSDGDLRYRTSVDLGPAEISDEPFVSVLRMLIHHNLSTMDEWWDSIEAVVGGADPATVVG